MVKFLLAIHLVMRNVLGNNFSKYKGNVVYTRTFLCELGKIFFLLRWSRLFFIEQKPSLDRRVVTLFSGIG